MKRQFFVVANPASGNSKKLDHILKELVDYFSDNKFKYEVFLTLKNRNAWKTVEENLDESITDLVIIGGDGTINEAINGLKHDIPVSIIPNGTGNDYIKMLNIGNTLEQHIQVLANGTTVAVDVGTCNGRKFLNGVGVGFDGQIVADMLGKKSILKGPAKYYSHVLSILATYKARLFNYSVDGEKKSNDLILLCVAKGSTFGGSFVLTPDAKLDDGKLYVCETGKISGLKRFLNIHKLQGGTHGSMRAVSLYTCDNLSIEANPQLQSHIDGEAFGQPPFVFGILKGGLRVRVKS